MHSRPMSKTMPQRATGAAALVVAVAIAMPVPVAVAASPEADPPTPVSDPEPAPDDGVAPGDATELDPILPDPLDGARHLDADGLFESEQRAYQLYMEGVRALEEDLDPDVAIDRWQEALRVLPDERPYARSRGALALRLVTAYDMRFHRDGRIDDLRRQSALLQGYQQRLPEMFADDPAARAQRNDHARARVDEIDAELRRIAAVQGTVEEQLDKSLRGEYEARRDDVWRPDPTDAGWHARPDDPRRKERQATDSEVAPEEPPAEPELDQPKPKKEGTGPIAAGAVLGVAGLAGIGVGIAAMVTAAAANDFDASQTPSERRAQIARGNQANTRAVVGLAAGGALAAAGVALLAIGLTKRKKSANASPLAVHPTIGAGRWGLGLTGRF